MNPLIKKEIRLMLPAWLAVLMLEAGLPWVFHDIDRAFGFLPIFFFFGCIILATSSFGREFSAGTFQILMSQPVERMQIWRIKATVLFASLATIYLICYVSCWIQLDTILPDQYSVWAYNSGILADDFQNAMKANWILALVAVAGGLWTTLLFRQVSTAFWITFLAPAGLVSLIALFTPPKTSNGTITFVLETVAGVYVVATLLLARWLFYRAQDVGWNGGIISFSRWKYFETRSETVSTTRSIRPYFALWRKEFQLHGITLIGAAGMLVVQIVVFFLRAYYSSFHKNSDILALTDFFWVLWLLFPLVIGCTAVAEERRLGVLDQQFCLPISRRAQFWRKFIPGIILGVFLGGLMPLLLETIAGQLGASNEIFSPEIQFHPSVTSRQIFYSFGSPENLQIWFKVCVIGLSAGFGLAAFFGSTFARNFLQALSIAIATIISFSLLVCLINAHNAHYLYYGDYFYSGGGTLDIPMGLYVLIALPTIPAILIWLSYFNFKYFQNARRGYLHNTLILSGGILAVFVIANAIYNRPWEWFTAIKSPSGPIRLNKPEPITITSDMYRILAQLPDDRIWIESTLFQREPASAFFPSTFQLWETKSTRQTFFLGRSNWVDVASGGFRTFGIQSDGTLWSIHAGVNDTFRAMADYLQIGTETDWARAVGNGGSDIILLKKDGSLWYLNVERERSGESSEPIQIGTDKDWTAISPGFFALLHKRDGSAWTLRIEWSAARHVIIDLNKSIYPEAAKLLFLDFQTVEIDTNGRLWVLSEPPRNWHWAVDGLPPYARRTQLGGDAKWRAVTFSYGGRTMVGLRDDGTLWEWPMPRGYNSEIAGIRPRQLGSYTHWVALDETVDSEEALAADGSIWELKEPSNYSWLAPSRQPAYLGNIFSTTTSESSQ